MLAKTRLALRIDLQRLGMGCHGNIRNQAEVFRIYHGDLGWIRRVAAAVPHKEQMMSFVIDHVVRIVGEFDLAG